MRVALYIRVSSEEQALHGLSIEAQTEALRRWAKDNRADVVGEYVDAGISARKKASSRPALQKLLADVEHDLIDLIVFTKLDRWFRSVSEYYKAQEVLEAHGVDWRTIQEDYDTASASGRLKINIMLAVAQDEADRTSERIKMIFASKTAKREPISGKVPLGYKIENKKLVPDPETAPVAQDIFRQYIALRSISALRWYILDKYGLEYTHTSVRNLLKNERYIGTAHGDPEYCEPIIDYNTFMHAAEIRTERAERFPRARTGRVYLFAGLCYCAECGNRMPAHLVKNNNIYYRCSRADKLKKCTHKRHTSQKHIESFLRENIISSIERFNASAPKQKKPRPDAERVKAKLAKLTDLYLNDLIDKDIYAAQYAALSAQTAEPEEPEPRPIDTSELHDALKLYDELTPAARKELWSRTVSKIIISNTNEITIIPYYPYSK